MRCCGGNSCGSGVVMLSGGVMIVVTFDFG